MSHRERKQQDPIGRHDDMEIMRRVIDRFGLNGTSMAASLTGFIARKRRVPDSSGPADGLARAGDRLRSVGDDGKEFAAEQRDLGLGPALAKHREAERHVAGGYGRGEGDGQRSSQRVAVDSAGGGTPQAKKVIDGAREVSNADADTDLRDAEVLSRALRRLGISESTTAVEGWVAQRTKNVGASPQLTVGEEEPPPARPESESRGKIQPPSSRNPIEEDAARRHGSAKSTSLSDVMSSSQQIGLASSSSPPASHNGSTGNRNCLTAARRHPIERDTEQKSGSASSPSSSSGSPRMYGGTADHRHAVEQDFARRSGSASASSASPGMLDSCETGAEVSSLPKSILGCALPTPTIATPMLSFSEQDTSDFEMQARKIMVATKAMQGNGVGAWHSSSHVKIAPSKGTVVDDDDPIQQSQTSCPGQQQHGSQYSPVVSPKASQNSVFEVGPNARANNEDASGQVAPAAKDPASALRRQTPLPPRNSRSPVFGTSDERISQSPDKEIPPLAARTAQDEPQLPGASTIVPPNRAEDTAHAKAKLQKYHGGTKDGINDIEWDVVADVTSRNAGEKETVAVTGVNGDNAQDSNQLRVKSALDESVSVPGKTHGQGSQTEFASVGRDVMRDAPVPQDEKGGHIQSAPSSIRGAQGSAGSGRTTSASSSVSGAETGGGEAQKMPVMWSFKDRTGVAASGIPPAPKGGFCWQKGVDDACWGGALDGVKAHDARRRYAFAQPLDTPEGSKKMHRAGMIMSGSWASSGGMSRTVSEVVESVMRPLVDCRPLVLLRGSAGSGKTTILWEVERRLAGKRNAVYASGLIDSVSKLSGGSRNDRHGFGKSLVQAARSSTQGGLVLLLDDCSETELLGIANDALHAHKLLSGSDHSVVCVVACSKFSRNSDCLRSFEKVSASVVPVLAPTAAEIRGVIRMWDKGMLGEDEVEEMIRSARTKTPISATIQVVAAVQGASLGPREFGSVGDVLDQLLGAGKSSGKALVAALGGKGGSSDKNEVANHLGWTQQKLQECIASLAPLVWECGAGSVVCLSGNSVSKLLYTSSAGGDLSLPIQGLPKEITQFGVLAASSNLSSDLAHMIMSASTSDRDVALLLDTTAGLALRALQRCGQTRGLVGALGPLVQVASTGRFSGTGDRRAAMLFGCFGSGCPGDEAVNGLVKASIKGSVEARGILAAVLSSWMQASGLTGLPAYNFLRWKTLPAVLASKSLSPFTNSIIRSILPRSTAHLHDGSRGSMDLIDAVVRGEADSAIDLLGRSAGYRIYDQCNIFGMGSLHSAARRDGMIGILAEKAPVQALDAFDTSGRSAANILAEILERGVACEGDLHALMLRGACMTSRGQLRGEKSAAEVIAKVGSEAYNLHSAASIDAASVRECLAWRAQWHSICIPSGGLEADGMGRTPLHAAALRGDAEACKALLEARADASKRDWRGWTALHVAASGAHDKAVVAILAGEGRAIARIGDALGRMPLHVWKYGVGLTEGLRSLAAVSDGGAIGAGMTPLMVCAASGAGGEELLGVWKALGVVDMSQQEEGWPRRSVAGLCAVAGSVSAVEALALHHPQALSAPDALGRHPINDVSSKNMAKLLPETIALMWRGCTTWPTALSPVLADAVSREGALEMVLDGVTILGAAVRRKDMETLRQALKLGSDPGTDGGAGSAFCLACVDGWEDGIRMMLRTGKAPVEGFHRVHLQVHRGISTQKSPLDTGSATAAGIAAANGHLDVVMLLIKEAGADPCQGREGGVSLVEILARSAPGGSGWARGGSARKRWEQVLVDVARRSNMPFSKLADGIATWRAFRTCCERGFFDCASTLCFTERGRSSLKELKGRKSQDLVRDVALACLRGGSGSEVALRALVTGVPHLMPGMCERAGGGWGFWLAGRSLIIEALKQRNYGCIRVLAQAVLGEGTNQRARVCCSDAMRLITSTGTHALVESGVRIGDMLGKVWIPATNEEERLNCMMEMVVETADQRLRKRGQGSTHGQKGNPVNSLAIHAGRDSMLKGSMGSSLQSVIESDEDELAQSRSPICLFRSPNLARRSSATMSFDGSLKSYTRRLSISSSTSSAAQEKPTPLAHRPPESPSSRIRNWDIDQGGGAQEDAATPPIPSDKNSSFIFPSDPRFEFDGFRVEARTAGEDASRLGARDGFLSPLSLPLRKLEQRKPSNSEAKLPGDGGAFAAGSPDPNAQQGPLSPIAEPGRGSSQEDLQTLVEIRQKMSETPPLESPISFSDGYSAPPTQKPTPPAKPSNKPSSPARGKSRMMMRRKSASFPGCLFSIIGSFESDKSNEVRQHTVVIKGKEYSHAIGRIGNVQASSKIFVSTESDDLGKHNELHDWQSGVSTMRCAVRSLCEGAGIGMPLIAQEELLASLRDVCVVLKNVPGSRLALWRPRGHDQVAISNLAKAHFGKLEMGQEWAATVSLLAAVDLTLRLNRGLPEPYPAGWDAKRPSTCLHFACAFGDLPLLRRCILVGSDTSKRTHHDPGLWWKRTRPASSPAAKRKEIPPPFPSRKEGISPLHIAISYNHLDLVEPLLDAGADPRYGMGSGCALESISGMRICGRRRSKDLAMLGTKACELARAIVSRGGLVNSNNGRPYVLVRCLDAGLTDAVEELLAGDSRLKNDMWRLQHPAAPSPIMAAVRHNEARIVQLLLEAGCDHKTPRCPKTDQTVVQVAVSCGAWSAVTVMAHFAAGKALAAGGAQLLACSSSLAGCGALDQEKSIKLAKVLSDEISRGGSDDDVGIMMFPSHLEPSFSALSEEECRLIINMRKTSFPPQLPKAVIRRASLAPPLPDIRPPSAGNSGDSAAASNAKEPKKVARYAKPIRNFRSEKARTNAEIASERLSGAQFASSLARLGGVEYPIQLLVSLFTATARTKATLCSSARASHSLGAPRSRRGAFADRDAFQQLLSGHQGGGLIGISAVIGVVDWYISGGRIATSPSTGTGALALRCACADGCSEIVEKIAEAGKDKAGSMLDLAICMDPADTLGQGLYGHAWISKICGESFRGRGVTCIHLALRSGHLALARRLIELGSSAKVGYSDPGGVDGHALHSLLQLAPSPRDSRRFAWNQLGIDIAKMPGLGVDQRAPLLGDAISPNGERASAGQPVHRLVEAFSLAVKRDFPEVALELLSRKDAQSLIGTGAAAAAAEAGLDRVFEEAVRVCGCSSENRDVMRAAIARHARILSCIVRLASEEEHSSVGVLPAMFHATGITIEDAASAACLHGDLAALKSLCEMCTGAKSASDAVPHLKMGGERKLLESAVNGGNVELLEALLKGGCDASCVVWHAMRRGSEECIKSVLNRAGWGYASVDPPERYRSMGLLHVAAARGLSGVVDRLIAEGHAPEGVSDYWGNSPGDYACMSPNLGVSRGIGVAVTSRGRPAKKAKPAKWAHNPFVGALLRGEGWSCAGGPEGAWAMLRGCWGLTRGGLGMAREVMAGVFGVGERRRAMWMAACTGETGAWTSMLDGAVMEMWKSSKRPEGACRCILMEEGIWAALTMGRDSTAARIIKMLVDDDSRRRRLAEPRSTAADTGLAPYGGGGGSGKQVEYAGGEEWGRGADHEDAVSGVEQIMELCLKGRCQMSAKLMTASYHSHLTELPAKRSAMLVLYGLASGCCEVVSAWASMGFHHDVEGALDGTMLDWRSWMSRRSSSSSSYSASSDKVSVDGEETLARCADALLRLAGAGGEDGEYPSILCRRESAEEAEQRIAILHPQPFAIEIPHSDDASASGCDPSLLPAATHTGHETPSARRRRFTGMPSVVSWVSPSLGAGRISYVSEYRGRYLPPTLEFITAAGDEGFRRECGWREGSEYAQESALSGPPPADDAASDDGSGALPVPGPGAYEVDVVYQAMRLAGRFGVGFGHGRRESSRSWSFGVKGKPKP